MGSDPNGASGSAARSGHWEGTHGASRPLPSQQDTSSPFGAALLGSVPPTPPHAYRTAVGAEEPAGRWVRSTFTAPGAAPMDMCTGTHWEVVVVAVVTLTRTAVAESAAVDWLYLRTVSFRPFMSKDKASVCPESVHLGGRRGVNREGERERERERKREREGERGA